MLVAVSHAEQEGARACAGCGGTVLPLPDLARLIIEAAIARDHAALVGLAPQVDGFCSASCRHAGAEASCVCQYCGRELFSLQRLARAVVEAANVSAHSTVATGLAPQVVGFCSITCWCAFGSAPSVVHEIPIPF